MANIHTTHIKSAANLALAAGFTYALYLLFSPFLLALVSGAIIALVSRPLQEWLDAKGVKNTSLSATITLFCFALGVLAPLALVFSMVAREATNAAINLGDPVVALGTISTKAADLLDQLNLSSLLPNIATTLRNAVAGIGEQSVVLLGGVAGALASSFLALVTSFYCLANYAEVRKGLISFSPLSRKDDELVLSRIREVVRATVIGSLTLVGIQAVTSMVGLAIFGIGSPVLIGTLYGLSSLVPAVGGGLIWVPTVVIQLLQGNYVAGIGFGLWSLVQVLLYDNLLGPKLIQKRARLHPFFVLLGILGGVNRFGPIGLFLGPTLVAVGMIGVELLRRAWDGDEA
jgi:predicted PurR-regulated permease PerM